MYALTTSFASASPASSPTYLVHEGDSRSRQALEAVDAYLGWGSTYAAPRAARSRMAMLLDGLVEKLLK
jgi:hypothetical protein